MAPVEHSFDNDELDLRAYLAVLRRRWKTVAVVVVVAVAMALGMALTQTSQYRATSELLIRQSDSAQVISETPIVNANEAARRLNNEVRLFESGAVESAVAEVYDGPLDPENVRASVSSDTSDVVEASLTAADPDEAVVLVDLYVETFLEVRRTQRIDELLAVGSEIQAKIDELDAQIGEISRPLDDLDARLAADPGGELAAQRADLATQLSPRLAPLESQRAFYQNQIDDLELTADITRTAGAQVLTAAEPSDGPVSPKPVRDASIAVVLGLVLGVGLAFLKDTLDERIRGVADLEQVSGGLPTLALVPEVEKGHDHHFVAVRDDARSTQAEAFRSLRTAVKFAGLDKPLKVVQVTSPSQGEGKTTAVANLAVALAQGGDRVAVVCCDLRRPRVQDRFGVELTPGLTDVLVGDATLANALRRYDANVLVLPAGTPPPNPSELLSSHKAAAVIKALAEEFDVVLVDSTPVLPVTDALVVSRFVDATLVVVDSRSTARRAVGRTLQMLGQVNAPVLGIVLNGLPEGGGYGYGYGYSYEAERTGARMGPTRSHA
ncbi:MAG: polysaccharide biosynthesis tyrosine autokinase [Acidimicrobiales bacterium]